MPVDHGKQVIFEERRIKKSQDVRIVFVDAENNFNVVNEEGDLKYCGRIIGKEPHIDDYCGCESFMHGNVEAYTNEYGFSFQCKHLVKARMERYQGHPEIKPLEEKLNEIKG